MAPGQRPGLLVVALKPLGITVTPISRPVVKGAEEIGRRVERVGGDVEIAGAIGQNVLGHELGLADLAMHGAARGTRQHAAVDDLQRRVAVLARAPWRGPVRRSSLDFLSSRVWRMSHPSR